jgi:peptide/nickel transport system ATP-binding protein
LSAAPDPARAETPVLKGSGAPPSLVTPPPGCRFHPRCPMAMKVCTQQVPEALAVGADHVSACWLHASGLSSEEREPWSGRADQVGAVAVGASAVSGVAGASGAGAETK